MEINCCKIYGHKCKCEVAKKKRATKAREYRTRGPSPNELAIKLINFSYDDEDLDYMRHQLNNFRKFLDDYKLTVSNIWLDFGYWLNVADVISRL